MGQPKPLLLWHGVPLVQYQVASLVQAGIAETIVVLGHRADEVAPHVPSAQNVRVVINTQYRQGKTTSIKLGLRHVSPQAEHLLVLGIDQPRPPNVLARLIQAHTSAGALISVPVYGGRRGHPPVVSRRLFPELTNVSEEKMGLREIAARHADQVNEVPFDTLVVRLDLNTQSQYQAALQEWGQ